MSYWTEKGYLTPTQVSDLLFYLDKGYLTLEEANAAAAVYWHKHMRELFPPAPKLAEAA